MRDDKVIIVGAIFDSKSVIIPKVEILTKEVLASSKSPG